MSTDVEKRIGEVFRVALRLPERDYPDETRRGELEAWDSLGHLALMQALSDAFDLEVTPEQALDLETLGDVRRFVAESGSS